MLSLPDAEPTLRRRAELLAEERRQLLAIPAELYTAHAELLSRAYAAWLAAKEANDFSLLAGPLKEVIADAVRFAGLRHPELPVYDAALSEYEQGLTADTLTPFFDLMKRELTPLILELGSRPAPEDGFLRGYPAWQQRRFAEGLTDLLGLDRSRCALAETEHPFTAFTSRSQVRLTTHYHESDLSRSMFSVLHEGGHSLYRLNLPEALTATAAAQPASAAVDESQSRFYENIIGRSLPFCRAVLPLMRSCFPELPRSVTPEALYRAVNAVRPGPIRLTADELTYPMHILLRYELERALLEGSLTVADLPGEWNRLCHEYLGVTVTEDRLGVLQDMHWPGGLIGYFPGYALGSAYGPQLLARMEADTPDLWASVERGDLSPATDWLRRCIHCQGRLLPASELLTRAFGGPFRPQVCVDYLKKKYTALYEL